jgi:ribosome-associated toxin RatA of RatAB toxin-antitoxin module
VRPVACLCLPALVLALAPAWGADITLNVTRNGDAFSVEASAEFEGTIPATWKALTDYGSYADYIPGMVESRVVSRRGDRAEVEQKGEARVLFLVFPIEVKLAVVERPYERVESRAVSGSFREMRSTYSMEAGQGRVVLRYAGRMVPDFYVPPLIGTLLLKRNIEDTFVALVEEIERRNRPGEPGKR